MQEILEAIASGLKLDAEQFIADFKNGEDFISEKEAAGKLSAFISDKVKAANETAKKVGRSEVSKRYERHIKSSGFENSEGLEGEELFKSFLSWKDEQAQAPEGDPKTMGRDELLKHAVVKTLISEREAKAAEKWALEKKELEQKVAQAENTRKTLLLDQKLLSALEKGRVNLGDTPEMREMRKNLIKTQVKLERIELDGDKFKYLDEEGFEADFEKEILSLGASAFGIVKQDPSRSGANPQAGGAAGAGAGEYKPKYTFAGGVKEYNDLKTTLVDPQERLQVEKDWRHIQQQAAGN